MLIKDLSNQQKDLIKNYRCIGKSCKICPLYVILGKPSCISLLIRKDVLCLKILNTDIDYPKLEKLCQK